MNYIIKTITQNSQLLRMANMPTNLQSTKLDNPVTPTMYQIFKEVTLTDQATGNTFITHQLVTTLDADAFSAIQDFAVTPADNTIKE
jgi:hypothetical protein